MKWSKEELENLKNQVRILLRENRTLSISALSIIIRSRFSSNRTHGAIYNKIRQFYYNNDFRVSIFAPIPKETAEEKIFTTELKVESFTSKVHYEVIEYENVVIKNRDFTIKAEKAIITKTVRT